MRVAAPKRQAVQSLGRHSIGNTGMEGDIAKIAAITTVAEQGAYQATEIIDKRQRQKADLEMQEADAAFRSKYEGREFLSVDEVPPHLLTASMEKEGQVTTAQVLPSMYDDHVKAQLESASEYIDLDGSRQQWLSDKQGLAIQRVGKLQIKANESIERQVLNQQKTDLEDLIDRGRIAEAEEMLKGMSVDSAYRTNATDIINEKAETSNYDNIIRQSQRNPTPENRAALEGAIDNLEKDYDEYLKDGGELGTTNARVWHSKLLTELDRLETEETNISKYAKETLRYQIEQAKSVSGKGKFMDEEELADLHRRTEIMNKATEGEFTKELLELEDAINLAGTNNEKKLKSSAQRQAMTDSYQPTDTRGLNLKDDMQASDRARTNLENDDFATAVSESGLYPEGLAPVDLKDPNYHLNMSRRFNQIKSAEGTFGAGLADNGIFTNAEADQLSKAFNDATVDEQMGHIARINSTLGENADIVYGQLAIKGQARTFAVAGSIPDYAYAERETTLKGMRHAKENADELKDIRAGVEAAFMGSNAIDIYKSHPKQRAAIKEAAMNHYIGSALSGGTSLTGFDKDTYEKSLEAVSGGSFEYNGTTFVNPEYGMPDAPMDVWISRTSYRYIAENSPVSPMGQAYSAKEFWEDFQNEDTFRLAQADDTGHFLVYAETSYGPIALKDQNGNAWILKYDSTAPLKKDDPRPDSSAKKKTGQELLRTRRTGARGNVQ